MRDGEYVGPAGVLVKQPMMVLPTRLKGIQQILQVCGACVYLFSHLPVGYLLPIFKCV
jgi:hypothetical protein